MVEVPKPIEDKYYGVTYHRSEEDGPEGNHFWSAKGWVADAEGDRFNFEYDATAGSIKVHSSGYDWVELDKSMWSILSGVMRRVEKLQSGEVYK